MRGRLALVAAILVAAVAAATASADRATLTPSEVAPWDGGTAVVTPLEALAGRIATHIAGHAVAVHCEPASGLRATGSAADAAGMVHVLTDPRTGRYAKTSSVIELSSTVCGSLQLFAQTSTKPTRCAPTGSDASLPCFTGAAAAASGPSVCVGKSRTCYGVAAGMTGDYWQLYNNYAQAIETLAHEAVHTAQAQKGKVRPRGDLVEQQAECWGMQWLPWVATQFGDAGDDAQTVATYYWLFDYPAKRTAYPAYWSTTCVPGGSLDIRAGRAGAWP